LRKEELMSVRVDKDGQARVIVMDSGENRFNRDFLDSILGALDEVASDHEAACAVITGAHEKHFSGGFDLEWISTAGRGLTKFLLDFVKYMHYLFLFPKPVVAAINGHAFAGGLLTALCCDWRVMRQDRGWCCFPEVDIGIQITPGVAALVSHVTGRRNADLIFLTGRRLDGPRSLALGLVDEIAAAEAVLPRAIEVAKELGSKDRTTFAAHKRRLRADAARVLLEDDPVFIRSRTERTSNV